jgi:hypothetical protein
MRLSCLVVVVLLVVTSNVFAQRSSAVSSSSFSGGGSHGGSVASSSGSNSSSTHSSGASAPHSSGSQFAHSTPSGLNMRQPIATATAMQTEKRGFFSHLRHPFRGSAPMLETSLRLPVCKKEPCALPVCPRGQSLNGNGICAATNLGALNCQAGNYLGTGACGPLYPSDCRGLALALNDLALTQDEQARQAKSEIIQREYAQCLDLRSLFPLGWESNSLGSSFAGSAFDSLVDR